MENRTSSLDITNLLPNEIFTFGSNLVGRHGKGAAKTAMKWGAKYGQGAGLMGRTYGIPTKGYSMKHILSLDAIQLHVDRFAECAFQNPNLTFLVTQIGCGLAEYTPKQIAPLFKNCTELNNVHLPRSFWRVLSHLKDKTDKT